MGACVCVYAGARDLTATMASGGDWESQREDRVFEDMTQERTERRGLVNYRGHGNNVDYRRQGEILIEDNLESHVFSFRYSVDINNTIKVNFES